MLNKKMFTKTTNWLLASLIDLFGGMFIKSSRQDLKDIKNILIIRTDGIGDFVVNIPLINSLKKIYPDCRITCLVRPRCAEVSLLIPKLDRVIVSVSKYDDIRKVAALRSEGIDLAIDTRPESYSFEHLLLYLSKSRVRAGYAHKGMGFLLNKVVQWNGEKDMLSMVLDTAKALGDANPDSKIEINTESQKKYIDELLAGKGVSDKSKIAVVNPFAGHPFNWESSKIIELCEKLNRLGFLIVFTGDKKSVDKIEMIAGKLSFKAVNLAGETSLLQLIELLKRAAVLITPDSGPRHLANAAGTPAVVLRNGANSSIYWGKYSSKEEVIIKDVQCAPCGKKVCPENIRICMNNISVDEVLNKVKYLIKLPL